MPVPQPGGVAAPGRGVLCRRGWRPGRPRPPARGSPAHDLVGQQHAAHLRVLVLALVDDGLSGDKQRRGLRGALRSGAQSPQAPRAPRAAGAWRTGEAQRPTQATLAAGSPGAGRGLGGFRACAGGPSAPEDEDAACRPGEARAQGARATWQRPRRPLLPAPPRAIVCTEFPAAPHEAAQNALRPEPREEPRPEGQFVWSPGPRPPRPERSPGRGRVGAWLLPAFKPRCPRRAALPAGLRGALRAAGGGRPEGRGAAAARGRAGPRPRGLPAGVLRAPGRPAPRGHVLLAG